MDCQLFELQAQRGIDGLLATHEHEDMLHHAAGCPSCAALLQDMEALEALLSPKLGMVEAPQGFAESVMAALPEPYRKPVLLRLLPRQRSVRFGGIAAAAALLIAVGAYSLWPASPTVAPPEQNIVAQEETPLTQTEPDSVKPQAKPNQTKPNNTQAQLPEDDPDAVLPNEEEPQDPGTPATEQIPQPYSTSVDLPQPAYNPQAEGTFSLTLLASYEDCDALLPSFNEEGLVVFYIKYKGLIHQWTQTASAQEAPEYVGQVKALPSLSGITGSVNESQSAGYPYVTALSPDGRITAVNRGGDYRGVWLFEDPDALSSTPEEGLGTDISNGNGGGAILSWSPDGNKLLYTDATGKLFVHYLYMPTPYSLALYDGNVTCASWAEDGKTVIFAGKADKSARSSIYAISIP